MFDRFKPSDLAALVSEVREDPAGIGYDIGNTSSVLEGLARETGAEVQSEVLVSDLVGIFAANAEEFIGLVARTPPLGTLATCVCSLDDNKDVSTHADKLAALIPGTMIAADVKSRTRRLTRAEELFGEGSEVTRADWIAARELG